MSDQTVVTRGNLGSGFDLGIAEPNKISVKGSALLWSGNFDEPDIHANDQPINIVEARADSGWVKVGANGMQFTGAPDHVEISGHHVASNTGNYWPNVRIQVLRNDAEIAEASALHMDTNGTYSGQMSVAISFVDATPGVDPVYTFRSFENDNRTMNNATIASLSPITLKAVI